MKFALILTENYKVKLEAPELHEPSEGSGSKASDSNLITIIDIDNPAFLEKLLSYSQFVIDATLLQLSADADEIADGEMTVIDTIRNQREMN